MPTPSAKAPTPTSSRSPGASPTCGAWKSRKLRREPRPYAPSNVRRARPGDRPLAQRKEPSTMTTITIEKAVFATTAEAVAWAQEQGWDVFVRGAKKAVAFRTVGTGKARTTEAMFLGGAEGSQDWQAMRSA